MFTAAFTNIAFYARMLRTSMLDVMKQDYIYTAKSKGLNKTEIVKRHMIRNSLLPLVTSFGPMCAGVLTGNFVVEKIFNIPGIGQARRKALMKHFMNLDAIKNASVEELKNLPSMNEKSAKDVYNFFH